MRLGISRDGGRVVGRLHLAQVAAHPREPAPGGMDVGVLESRCHQPVRQIENARAPPDLLGEVAAAPDPVDATIDHG
jgi:hypothetical protein